MIYSIYIPHARGADRQHLVDVGLGELHRDGDADLVCADVLKGPDNNPGQIWTWQEGDNVAAFQPERQTWQPCHADGDLPAGRFWWGFVGPLGELDLRRKEVLPGRPITLGNETWLVPNITSLPETYAFDASGQPAIVKRREYRWFADDCEWAFAQILGDEPIDVWKQFRVATRMLSLNYRVTPELLMRLELVSPDDAIQILLRACDHNRLQEVIAQVGNQEGGAPGPSGSTA